MDITPEKLVECLGRIENKEVSISEASRMYNISRKTLYNKIKLKHRKTVGHPRVFSDAEERGFVKHLLYLADCACPFTKLELKVSEKNVIISKYSQVVVRYSCR